MFVPSRSGAPVTLAVVAYGATERLRRCLDALIAHESVTDFEVVCVVNPNTRSGSSDVSWVDPRVAVVLPELNLGWAGGLHLARTRVTGPLMVWIQDDMVPLAGWLDALVSAADALPGAACFGSLSVGADGRPDGVAAGRAEPADVVARWNETDHTRESLPEAVTTFDWVTSKGMLTRTEAWDAIGGPDVRLYPLDHVDKQYATHLRAHGWDVAFVPTATLAHALSQSSPRLFRRFLNGWHDDDFNATWGPVAAELAVDATSRPGHPCPPAPTIAEVERACAIEATRMVVPLARFAVGEYEPALARYDSSKSWRWTAPLRSIVGTARRLARR